MHIAYFLLPYYPLQKVRRGTYPLMMTTMMMFGVSCVNNVWWEVEEGALGNSNERLPQVQAQPHFSDTNPFSPTDVIFQNLQRSPCFFVSNADHLLDGQVDNPM